MHCLIALDCPIGIRDVFRNKKQYYVGTIPTWGVGGREGGPLPTPHSPRGNCSHIILFFVSEDVPYDPFQGKEGYLLKVEHPFLYLQCLVCKASGGQATDGAVCLTGD